MLDIIKTRRSIRRFSPQSVTDTQVHTLLEAARWAPSAGNVQPWHFFVVRDDKIKTELAKAALFQEFVARAAVDIVVTADLREAESSYFKRGVELYCIQDTAAAIQNILLTAHSMGLGACWVGAFDELAVRRILNLESHLRPVAIVAIGYPADKPSTPPRKPIDRITTFL